MKKSILALLFTLFVFVSLFPHLESATLSGFEAISTQYIEAWKSFYPSRACSRGILQSMAIKYKTRSCVRISIPQGFSIRMARIRRVGLHFARRSRWKRVGIRGTSSPDWRSSKRGWKTPTAPIRAFRLIVTGGRKSKLIGSR